MKKCFPNFAVKHRIILYRRQRVFWVLVNNSTSVDCCHSICGEFNRILDYRLLISICKTKLPGRFAKKIRSPIKYDHFFVLNQKLHSSKKLNPSLSWTPSGFFDKKSRFFSLRTKWTLCMHWRITNISNVPTRFFLMLILTCLAEFLKICLTLTYLTNKC